MKLDFRLTHRCVVCNHLWLSAQHDPRRCPACGTRVWRTGQTHKPARSWQIDGIYPGIVDPRPHQTISTGNRLVCYVPATEDAHNANATLIASAPALLEACKAVLGYGPDHIIQQVRQAIAQAEGKE